MESMVDVVRCHGTVNCASGVGLVEGGESIHLDGGERGGMFALLKCKPKTHAQGDEMRAI